MMNDHDTERYLRGDMTPEDMKQFEKQLAEDPLLAEGLEGLREWTNSANRTYEDLKTELDGQIDDIVPVAPKPSIRKNRKYWQAALVAMLLSGILLFAFLLQLSPDPERLFADHFRPLSHPDMTVRGNPDSGQVYPAVKAYETENYKQAIIHYKQLAEQEPNEEKHRLFLGIAYLANNQHEKAAATLFEPFSVRAEFEDDRQWYLALAYLRIHHFPEALTILKGLAESDTYYREGSQKLIRQLD